MPVELHVISDNTGETAARVARAVQRQFPEQEFAIVRHPRITSVDDVQLSASRARGRSAVVIYTLVDPQFRETMRTVCRRYRLRYCDLLRQPIEAVAHVSGAAAQMKPGPVPPLDSAYFRRVEAMEFAVRFDDGRETDGLRDAEIVLVGVSRTSKTPLSMYLGYLGYKVANVPVILGIEPPRELFATDSSKVIGLTIEADHLADIRVMRMKTLNGLRSDYSDLVKIYEELEQAASVHRRLGCPVIDVTNASVEETAYRVIQLVEQRQSAVIDQK